MSSYIPTGAYQEGGSLAGNESAEVSSTDGSSRAFLGAVPFGFSPSHVVRLGAGGLGLVGGGSIVLWHADRLPGGRHPETPQGSVGLGSGVGVGDGDGDGRGVVEGDG